MTTRLFTSLGILVVALCLAASGQAPAASHSAKSKATQPSGVPAAFKAAAKNFVADGCDASLWQHVYHPQRLKVVEKCIAVTGTIHHVKREADGDDHIQLKLDPEFAALLNDKNTQVQAGCLVVEPVCQGPVTQADAQAACRDFHSPVEVFAKGKHVRILGSYVLDSEANHGWMEIHPVTAITGVP
jgi:hypothetical protein